MKLISTILLIVLVNTSFIEQPKKLYLCQCIIVYYSHPLDKYYIAKVVESTDTYQCQRVFINWVETKKRSNGYIASNQFVIQELRDDNILK